MLVIDHIVPVASGGSDDQENLATACEECNFGKSDRPILGPPPTPSQLAEAQAIKEERFDMQGHAASVSALIEEREEFRRLVETLYETEVGHPVSKPSTLNLLVNLHHEFGDELATMLSIVASKDLCTENDRIRYLCGVARNKRGSDEC